MANGNMWQSKSMRMAWRVARRECRSGTRGFKIFVMCLMLGVASIAAVGSVSEGIKTAIDNDGRLLLGGDVDIRLTHSPATKKQLVWLKQNSLSLSQVVQMRVMTQSLDKTQNILAELKAVDEFYPLFGGFRLKDPKSLATALSSKTGIYGVAVEQQVLNKLSLHLGDKIWIGAKKFVIRAIIDREPDRSAQVFRLGPRIIISMGGLRATGLVKPGSLVRFHYRVGLDEKSPHKEWVRRLNAKFPKAGWRIQTIENAAPNVQRFTERVALFLNLVGLTTLLIGGIGIAIGVRSFVESRFTTVATLKSLGASGNLIFAVYLIQTLAIATIATIAGLALGIASPLIIGPFLEEYLGVFSAFGIYPNALLKAAIFGFLTSLIFSVWPLARAREVAASSLFRYAIHPPNGRPTAGIIVSLILLSAILALIAIITAEPMSAGLWFVLGTLFVLSAFYFLAKVLVMLLRRLKLRTKPISTVALNNLCRPDAQTPSVILALGMSLSVITVIVLIEENIRLQIDNTIPKAAPAYYFIDIQSSQKNEFVEIAKNHPSVSKVNKVPMLRGRIIKLAGVPVQSIKPPPEVAWVLRGDRGITWSEYPPEEGSAVVKGTWWPVDYAGPPLVSFDKAKAEAFGLDIGDTITINLLGIPLTARIANLRDINWNSLSINFLMIFSPNAVKEIPLSYVATAYFLPDASEFEELALAKKITQALPNVSAIRVKDVLADIKNMIGDIGVAVRVIGMITVCVSVLVLSGAIAANHNRRIYEAVILKVLGASRLQVVRIFAFEFFFLGLITAALSALVATGVSWGIVVHVMRADWTFLPGTLFITLLSSLTLTITGGLLATWLALNEKSTTYLRNE